LDYRLPDERVNGSKTSRLYAGDNQVDFRSVTEETRTALRNYDWLIRNRRPEDVELHWDSDTLVLGDGGVVIDELTRPGFTPATTG